MSIPLPNGIPLDISGLLAGLRKTADYIYFDGPLLSHYKGTGATGYLRYWCDVEGDCARWLLFEVSERDRLSYLKGKASLRSLILNGQNAFVYLIETDKEGEKAATLLAPVGNLAPEYLPAEDSFYEFEPSNVSQESANSYTILIGDKWSLRDLGEFRRLYERSYSFIYALSEMFPKEVRMESLKRVFSSLPWKGAFSQMHFFNQLINLVPHNASPEVVSISYASPGYIELSLSTQVADVVREMADLARVSEKALQTEINAIYDQLRPYNMLGPKGRPVQDITAPEELAMTQKLYRSFCAVLKFPLTEELLSATLNPLVALKIVISFTRRLWQLNEFGSGEKVQL